MVPIETGSRLFGYPAIAMVLFLVGAGLGIAIVLGALFGDRKARPSIACMGPQAPFPPKSPPKQRHLGPVFAGWGLRVTCAQRPWPRGVHGQPLIQARG